MQRFVIFGNSSAAGPIISQLKVKEPSSAITIFSIENELPYDRRLLPGFMAGDISSDKILIHLEAYYQSQNIPLVLGQKVARINFRKREITTEEKQKIPYDVLILTDTGTEKISSIKGTNKTGVFCSRRLSDVKTLAQNLGITETIVIEDDSPSGIEMAWTVNKKGKEAILVVSDRLLSSWVDEETSEIIRSLLEERGIRVIEKNCITEILGDGDVKAIRLQSGKVIATEAVLFGNTECDLKMFKNTELAVREHIVVNDTFQTNVANVYAVGDCCHSVRAFRDCDMYGQVVTLQIEKALGHLRGEEVSGRDFIPFIHIRADDVNINLLGQTQPHPGLQVRLESDVEHKRYKKVFLKNNCIVGAVLINRKEESEEIFKSIKEGQVVVVEDEEKTPGVGQEELLNTAETSQGFLPIYKKPELIDRQP